MGVHSYKPNRYCDLALTCMCVCVFMGVSVCKRALGGWKAVSNNAKMPGTGDY